MHKYQEKWEKQQELEEQFNRRLNLFEKLFAPSKKNQEWYNKKLQEIAPGAEVKWD